MKTYAIIVAYRAKPAQLMRLKKELTKCMPNISILVKDNTVKNPGLAASVNSLLREAYKKGGEIFIVCNTDIYLKKLDFKKLCEQSKHYGILGGVMEYKNTKLYGGHVDKVHMSGGLITKKPVRFPAAVDFVSGSLICITRECIKKVGYWDEDYFLYYEDADYCARAHKHAVPVGTTDAIAYEHYETSQKLKEKEYYLTRNRLFFILWRGSIKQKIYMFMFFPRLIKEAYYDPYKYAALRDFCMNYHGTYKR